MGPVSRRDVPAVKENRAAGMPARHATALFLPDRSVVHRDVGMRALLLAVLLAPPLLLASPVAAQEPAAALGLRTWFSRGFAFWGFQGGGVDPLSELRWRDTDAILVEVNAEARLERIVLMLGVGGGGVFDGSLLNEDFLESGRRSLFSRTVSDVDAGSVFYVNADVGYRVFRWPGADPRLPGYLDLFAGYQYWTEEHEAFGATGTVAIPPGTRVITHEYTWHSLRIGGRAQVPLARLLALRGSLVLLPYNHTRLEDVHHLRGDLRQDPSFSSVANGGFGVQTELGLTAAVWRGLGVHAGYRFWWIDSGEGDKFTHTPVGTFRDTLNAIVARRSGVFLQLDYRF
jgi:hypothetical protein